VVAIVLAVGFGFRAGRQARLIRWQNQPVHGWMTVPFIAHTHHVSPDVLYKAIGAEPRPRDHRPIRRLAHDQKRPVETLLKELTAAIQQNGGPSPGSSAGPPKRP
jgi:hypothetical protein